MSFIMLFVFMAGAVIAMPIAHALLMGAMAAAATRTACRWTCWCSRWWPRCRAFR